MTYIVLFPAANFPFLFRVALAQKATSSNINKGQHLNTFGSEEGVIKDVWADNFDTEFKKIMKLVSEYKFVGMVSQNLI